MIIKDDSWERWKRDVEEFRTTLPCEGQKYRWLIGYLGNPTSKIMFISEIPNLSERFTKNIHQSPRMNIYNGMFMKGIGYSEICFLSLVSKLILQRMPVGGTVG